MGDDCDARGLEDLVQRLNRVLFCRSFHSKLSPVGGLRLRARPPGCTHRLAQNLTSRHQSLGHAGQTTFEKPALPNQMARGVEVRTKSAMAPRKAA